MRQACRSRGRGPSCTAAMLAGLWVMGFLPLAPELSAADLKFRRGDSNTDGKVDMSDAVRTLMFLFAGGVALPCLDAGDSNDDGKLDLSDGIYTLNFLFAGGSAIPAPGPNECGLDSTADVNLLTCDEYDTPDCDQEPPPPSDLKKVGHVLNRIAYGPSDRAIADVNAAGIQAYIETQLEPETIDESGNTELNTREAALFTTFVPSKDTRIIAAGENWRYLKGTAAPPATWKNQGFDDSVWAQGPTGIGYDANMAPGNLITSLPDMQNTYLSVYIRKTFQVTDIAAIQNLILRVDYDDGFVGYLNGTEVARRGLTGNPPAFNATAAAHEAGSPEDIDITSRKNLLVVGTNTLAFQVHNVNLTSSDLLLVPELLDREPLPLPPVELIRGVTELQQLVHVRGVYSEKQLQAVLGEFWENHFTTDFDKVAEYFNMLLNSDATDAMTEGQARREAAQLDYKEYEFFYENALGKFEDLILYSATSPSMLAYLDNILNVAGAPNENYAREILELFAMGAATSADIRYTQKDIEQLAECFTGWTVCKVAPENAQDYPLTAQDPPNECGVQYEDTQFMGLGGGWRYFKGTQEPSPNPTTLEATTQWTTLGFDDTTWIAGSTGIGYGDGDDTTTLSDMLNGYRTVYLRRKFSVPDPQAFKNLILEGIYDDGFVAYLNGVEVARTPNMEDYGSPPTFNNGTGGVGHEASEGAIYFNLNRYRGLLVAGAGLNNVLAIQVHNVAIDSSDLTMKPRLLDREILPGSIENGDPTGVWTFRFDPTKHDTTTKILFEGTPHQMNIPAGRVGANGLQDAMDPVKAIANHPNTRQYICVKLIQKFVSDEISLPALKAGTVPQRLRLLLGDAMDTWVATGGDMREVMRTILDPVNQTGEFWVEANYRNKVKTPIEFINSSLRALESIASGAGLPEVNSEMGMALFIRDEPDGYSEIGHDWIDTASMRERIDFVQALAENRAGTSTMYRWNTLPYLDARGLDTAQEIVDHFDEVLFQNTLTAGDKARLIEFLTTDNNYSSLPLSRGSANFQTRVQEFVGFMLSMPQWNFQ